MLMLTDKGIIVDSGAHAVLQQVWSDVQTSFALVLLCYTLLNHCSNNGPHPCLAGIRASRNCSLQRTCRIEPLTLSNKQQPPLSGPSMSPTSSVLTCRLTKNDNATKPSVVTTQGNFQPGNEAQFVCPVTGQEFNGRFRFSVLKQSGHVISERALKQVRHHTLVLQIHQPQNSTARTAPSCSSICCW